MISVINFQKQYKPGIHNAYILFRIEFNSLYINYMNYLKCISINKACIILNTYMHELHGLHERKECNTRFDGYPAYHL